MKAVKHIYPSFEDYLRDKSHYQSRGWKRLSMREFEVAGYGHKEWHATFVKPGSGLEDVLEFPNSSDYWNKSDQYFIDKAKEFDLHLVTFTKNEEN